MGKVVADLRTTRFLSGACSWPESPHHECWHKYLANNGHLLICWCKCHKSKKKRGKHGRKNRSK